MVCVRCALRTNYVAKRGHVGAHRSVGPDPHVLDVAIQELQMMYTEDQINEKVMQGKIMEVQGRTMVATGSGPLSTQIKRP